MAVFDWAHCHERCWCSQEVPRLTHLESWAPVQSPCLWAETKSIARVSWHLPQAWERDAAAVGASQQVDLPEGAQTAPVQVERRPVPQLCRVPAPPVRVAPQEQPQRAFQLATLQGLPHLARRPEFRRSPRFRVGQARPTCLQPRQRVPPLLPSCTSAHAKG